jgi:aryl-alcohol dehydrogenase-like predicted oxidoreductase
VPIADSLGELNALQNEGKIRHIGLSNFDRAEVERCEDIRHVDSLQPQFSMLHLDERDLIAWCGERGTGVVTYGSLAYGLLTGAITMETSFANDDWRSGSMGQGSYYRRLFATGKKERSLAVVEGLRPIAERLGISVSQLALGWTFHQPGVTSAIAGSRNPRHVRANAEAGDVELDEAVIREIEEEVIPRGPGFA